MNDSWTPTTPERLAQLMAAIRTDQPAGNLAPRDGCVEGAIGNAVLAASYAQETDEPDVLHVAAYLMRSLARDHCYMDGNKRMAWLATLEVLAVHSATTVDADQAEAAAMVEQVATGAVDVPALIQWLGDHLVPWSADA